MRAYNFSPGPAMFPEEVMQQVHHEWLDWHQTQMSIVEIGHRTSMFTAVLKEAEDTLRQLLQIPSNYDVLFLTQPTRLMFSAIPMNFLKEKHLAGYAQTGTWSEMAYKEGLRYGHVYSTTHAKELDYHSIAPYDQWKLEKDTSYIHYVENETIHGLQFPQIPKIENIPLICDMTSSLLSKPLNISDFGMIYAGAQKNIAPAGLTIAIINKDLFQETNSSLPTALNFKFIAEQESLYYTPNTFSCYFALLNMRWLKKQGGLEAIAEVNRKKAQCLYDVIDTSNGFYQNLIHPAFRSVMNVVFKIHDPSLEAIFLNEAEKESLLQLAGHKLVGGLRASLYNAMPYEGALKLAEFMKEFYRRYG